MEVKTHNVGTLFIFRIKMQRLFAFIGICRLTLRGIDLDSDSNVIVGADFNCPLDPTIDQKRWHSNSSTTCDKFD